MVTLSSSRKVALQAELQMAHRGIVGIMHPGRAEVSKHEQLWQPRSPFDTQGERVGSDDLSRYSAMSLTNLVRSAGPAQTDVCRRC